MMTDGARELSFTRLLNAPRAAIWRCWTESDLLKQWFCPKPWQVSKAELDVRSGGSSLIVMNGPNGEEMPNRGVYLDVVPNQRLVFLRCVHGSLGAITESVHGRHHRDDR